MNILLISPFEQPIGLTYIAAYIREKIEGLNVKIIDAPALGYNDQDIENVIKEFKPTIVGTTASTPMVTKAINYLKIAKKIDKKILTVIGGIHATVMPEDTLKNKAVDIVVRNEGEETFTELINNINSYENIEGISYRKKGNIINNKNRKLIQDFNILPKPAWDLLPIDRYIYGPLKIKFINILTSKGCKGACNYCIHSKRLLGNNFRAKSPNKVVNEIIYLNKTYGIKYFRIVDDNFTYDKKRVMQFCRLINKKKLKIFIDFPNGTRADTVDYEMLKALKEAGCIMIAFGIESGNQGIVYKIGKGIHLDVVRKAVSDSKRAGINVAGFFMLGKLGENANTMQETINFAKELNCEHSSFSIATPYPGTIMWDVIKIKKGRILFKSWDEYSIFNKPTYELENVNKELINKYFKKANKDYYLRPLFILKLIKRILLPRNIIELNENLLTIKSSILIIKNSIRDKI